MNTLELIRSIRSELGLMPSPEMQLETQRERCRDLALELADTLRLMRSPEFRYDTGEYEVVVTAWAEFAPDH